MLINIQDLGTEYSLLIETDDSRNVKKIRIIDVDELLHSTLGLFSKPIHGTYENYLSIGLSMLTGFSSKTRWVCYENNSVPLKLLLEHAIDEDVDTIVLEYPDSFV